MRILFVSGEFPPRVGGVGDYTDRLAGALRRLASSRLGAAFDLKAFHDEVLAHGAIPLSTLRATISDWLG